MEQSQIVRWVRVLRGCCERHESSVCQELGLSASQLACLLSLPADQELGMGALARRLGLSPSRASRVADSLVRRELLSRRTPDKDRRALSVRLTRAGRSSQRAVERALAHCEQKLRRQLTTAQARQAERSLALVVAAFQAGRQ
jgi:DNA-binding MarR family transcriptional regulator